MLPWCKLRINIFALPVFAMILYLEGPASFFALMLAALLHEAGHLLLIWRFGLPVRRVDIEPMGALIVYAEEEVGAQGALLIALGGAMANILAFALSSIFFACCGGLWLLFFALCNFILAAANLLPREGLDGGRALFYFLLQRKDVGEAERICRIVSVVTTILILGLLLSTYVLLGFNRGILLLCGLVALQLV